jgi:hypothetical protein
MRDEPEEAFEIELSAAFSSLHRKEEQNCRVGRADKGTYMCPVVAAAQSGPCNFARRSSDQPSCVSQRGNRNQRALPFSFRLLDCCLREDCYFVFISAIGFCATQITWVTVVRGCVHFHSTLVAALQ